METLNGIRDAIVVLAVLVGFLLMIELVRLAKRSNGETRRETIKRLRREAETFRMQAERERLPAQRIVLVDLAAHADREAQRLEKML